MIRNLASECTPVIRKRSFSNSIFALLRMQEMFRHVSRLALLVLVCATLLGRSEAATTLLREFAGGANDGANPSGGLTLDGSTLYGTTVAGGDENQGTVFRINPNGSGFALLHEFDDLAGSDPIVPLTLNGSTIYGTTEFGGTGFRGTAFTVDTDGSDFAVLYNFSDNPANGSEPNGSATLIGSTLFGTTRFGGSASSGTVYKVNTDGSGFELLHSFLGGVTDGEHVRSSLTLVGSTFFGTTRFGGSAGLGTIFKINTDGSGYAVVRSFTGGGADGAAPQATLTLSGSELFGTTALGGDADRGTVFKMNLDGTGFTLLHEFAGGANDGSIPQFSPLLIDGATLFGVTFGGGDENLGTVFTMNADGSGYQLLHEFAGGSGDGSLPRGALVLSGTTLFGTTMAGGDANLGTLYAIAIPEPSSFILAGACSVFLAVPLRRKRRRCFSQQSQRE